MESNVLKLVQSIPRDNVLRIDIGMEDEDFGVIFSQVPGESRLEEYVTT